jgi:hypothetical protein
MSDLLQTYMALFLSLNRQVPYYYYDSCEKMYMIAYQVGDNDAMQKLRWIKENTHTELLIPLRVVESAYMKLSRSGKMMSQMVIGKRPVSYIQLQKFLDWTRTRVEEIFVDIGNSHQLPSVLPASSVMREGEDYV